MRWLAPLALALLLAGCAASKPQSPPTQATGFECRTESSDLDTPVALPPGKPVAVLATKVNDEDFLGIALTIEGAAASSVTMRVDGPAGLFYEKPLMEGDLHGGFEWLRATVEQHPSPGVYTLSLQSDGGAFVLDSAAFVLQHGGDQNSCS